MLIGGVVAVDSMRNTLFNSRISWRMCNCCGTVKEMIRFGVSPLKCNEEGIRFWRL